MERPGGLRRLGPIGCVKEKRSQPSKARDLYVSTLFVGRRRYVEFTCDLWWVLSAAHGLVDPDDCLEPYDVALKDQSRARRRAWRRGLSAGRRLVVRRCSRRSTDMLSRGPVTSSRSMLEPSIATSALSRDSRRAAASCLFRLPTCQSANSRGCLFFL
jgi:hypothetical protein